MDSNEIEQLYDGLLEILRSNGLGWVADQVAEEVSLGRILPRDFKTRQADMVQLRAYSDDDFEAQTEVQTMKIGSREILARDEYAPEDRLQLLIDALEEAVIHAGTMEDQLVEQLVPEDSDLPGVEFYSEVTNETTMTISRSSVRARYAHAERLKEHLDRLRREIFD